MSGDNDFFKPKTPEVIEEIGTFDEAGPFAKLDEVTRNAVLARLTAAKERAHSTEDYRLKLLEIVHELQDEDAENAKIAGDILNDSLQSMVEVYEESHQEVGA